MIPVSLLRGQRRRRDPRPPLVLPAAEAARHRDDVGIAELLQRLGRERRPRAAGAVHDDGSVTVGELVLDLALEVSTGDEHRARNGSLLELVQLAHVEERDIAEATLGLRRVDLSNLLLGLLEQVAEAGHALSRAKMCVAKCYRDGRKY